MPLLLSLLIIESLLSRKGTIISSPTYRYMPRKNSGIRGLSLRTEGAFGNAVFEGHIRYPWRSASAWHFEREEPRGALFQP